MSERKNWYDKSYKVMFIVPALILLASLVFLYGFQAEHGDLILKDVSLTGGTTITVFDSETQVEDLKVALAEEYDDAIVRGISDFRTGRQKGFFVETGAGVDEIKGSLESILGYKLNSENSSVEFTGASLSEGFYQQLRIAILIAFIFMGLVVFVIFRSFVPSAAVILSAFADIIMTLAVVDFFGIKLGIAGVIAFLMLIGYSVDTDILLTSRVLREREDPLNKRIGDAFKTGVTMTLTSIAAIAISLFIIYNFSETLRQIFGILLIGLGFDLVNTWFANAGILKWYVEGRK
tara:strand:- start:200 stop:1075 length:876 start_codon:yes stop_codon:yes gene_type:complete